MIEAKPEGTPLSGVEWQRAMYAEGLPAEVRLEALTKDGRLPFVFEASTATRPTSPTATTPTREPDGSSASPRPATLARTATQQGQEQPTWRAGQGDARADTRAAAAGADHGRHRRRDHLAISGTTAASSRWPPGRARPTRRSLSYRLLKTAAQRVLFLVDRNNLGKQTLQEFENYRTPDDGRRFTELYNVDRLNRGPMAELHRASPSPRSSASSRRCATRSRRRGRPELDGWIPDGPVTVAYNPEIPPEAFDLIIVDEATGPSTACGAGCWSTSTPTSSASPPPRQADLRLLPAEPRLRVHLPAVCGGQGQRRLRHLPDQDPDQRAGLDHRSRHRRAQGRPADPAQRYEALDEDLEYTASQLDRAVTATDQIRTVLETFRDRLFTEIFPGRTTVPKTLIFAKDDATPRRS